MYSDQTFRAFLLKMVDDDTEAGIEDGILDGSIDPIHLLQIEDELIDDSLFGRLSDEEKIHFIDDFLCTPERKRKVTFASVMKKYSAHHSPSTQLFSFWRFWRRYAAIPWTVPLAGALACALLAAGWLAERNLNLRRELAQSSQENHAREHVIASLEQEQKRAEGDLVAPHPSEQTSALGPRQSSGLTGQSAYMGEDLPSKPMMRLSSGVSRGLAAVPVLHLAKQTSTVSIEILLPFDARGALHEELLNSEDKLIWSQQFSGSVPIAPHGVNTILLPAALLTAGDYRLRVQLGNGSESPDKATYIFRVRRD